MFNIGTEIRVVESNIRRKHAGPKRHSLGYICENVPAWNSMRIANNEITIWVAKLEALFFRFGKDKESRLESKNIQAVFPISTTLPPDKTIDLTRAFVRTAKRSKNGLKSPYNLPIVIIIPENKPKNLDMVSGDQRLAYTISTSKKLKPLITQLVSNNNQRKVISSNNLLELRYFADEPKNSAANLAKIVGWKRIFKTINILNALFEKINNNEISFIVKHHLSNALNKYLPQDQAKNVEIQAILLDLLLKCRNAKDHQRYKDLIRLYPEAKKVSDTIIETNRLLKNI